MFFSLLKQQLQPDVIHGSALMLTHSGHDRWSVKGPGQRNSVESACMGNVQFFRAVAEQEICFGLLREQQTGVVVVPRSVAIHIEIIRVAIGKDDLPCPKHVSRGHQLLPRNTFAIALIQPSQSPLC